MIKADEAFRIGLVNKVSSPEALLDDCKGMAKKMTAKGPLAVSLAKQAVHEGFDSSMNAALQLEMSLFGMAFSTEDKNEGVGAFLEKRAPNFSGR